MTSSRFVLRSQRNVFLAVFGGAALIAVLAPALYFLSAPWRYSITVKNGAKDLDVPREMVALWPDTTHDISYFTQYYGEPSWRSQVTLCDADYMYELSFHASIRLSLTGMSVGSADAGELILAKHTLTQDPATGISIPSSGATVQYLDFGAWDAFVKTGGKDLSILGIGDCVPCP